MADGYRVPSSPSSYRCVGSATPGYEISRRFAEFHASREGDKRQAIVPDGRCWPLNSFPVQ